MNLLSPRLKVRFKPSLKDKTRFVITPLDSNMPKPKKIGVWAEDSRIEPKELIIPTSSSDPTDDIPTIPDLDDLQDLLEREISMPPMTEYKDKETANTLAEVVGGISGSVEGVEVALRVIKSFIPHVEVDTVDAIWTVESLLAQLISSDDMPS